jgi:hypothetical protein
MLRSGYGVLVAARTDSDLGSREMHYVGLILTRLGVFTSRPAAFLVVFAYVCGWLSFSPHTLDWEAIATLATCLDDAIHSTR